MTQMQQALSTFEDNFNKCNINKFEREYTLEFRKILNKWTTEDVDNQIVDFSLKILDIIERTKANPNQTLAVFKVLMGRLFTVTDNKPNPVAFKFFTGIIEIVSKKYPLFKELIVAHILKTKALSVMAKPYNEYPSIKDYYLDIGYIFTEGGKARETLERMSSERLSRYLLLMMYMFKANMEFYLPFLWRYVQAVLAAPINEFSPLILRVILEHSGEEFVKAYKSKFKKLLLYIKADHNEWERKLTQGAASKNENSNDFVAKMYTF